jgi:hypothetical protein
MQVPGFLPCSTIFRYCTLLIRYLFYKQFTTTDLYFLKFDLAMTTEIDQF